MERDEKSAPMETSELRERLYRGEPVVVVDVRSPQEFAEGHVEGAINIPVDQLSARCSELPSDATVVTVCNHGGARSAGAATQLRESGFEDARPLRGGTVGWFEK